MLMIFILILFPWPYACFPYQILLIMTLLFECLVSVHLVLQVTYNHVDLSPGYT